MRPRLSALALEATLSIRPGVHGAQEWIRDTLNRFPPGLQPRWETADSVRNEWRRVLRQSADRLAALPEPTGPRVLMASTFGLDRWTTVVDSLLMVALRLRGARPIGLLCDSAIPACEFNRYGTYRPDPGPFGPRLLRNAQLERCRGCTAGLAEPYGLLPVAMERLSRHAEHGDLERLEQLVDEVPVSAYRAFWYRNVGVGEHAFATTTRALKRGTLEDTPETWWLYRRYLLSSMWVVDLMDRLITRTGPERVVATHGIYVTHGTIGDVARAHGIPVAIGGSTYRQGTVSLFQGDTPHRAQHAEPTAAWDALELTPAMNARLDDYLRVRQGGGDDYNNYHRDSIADRASIARELGLHATRPVVALFPNLLWDAQILFASTLYPDMLDWIRETVRYVAGRTDLQLAIRVHPSEGRRYAPSAQPLLGEITRVFPVLPSNVRVIAPDSLVNSYALADMSDAALFYGARWAFEVAVRGVPVIVAGASPNRGKGFTHDPVTKADYFALLDRIPRLPRSTPEVIQRARRYAYHYHFRLSIDLPFTRLPGSRAADPMHVACESLDDLLPGRSPGLDVLCQGIMDGTTPFIYD